MRDEPLRESLAATEADLRWVLARAEIDKECAKLVAEYLEHGEFGEAYDVLNHCTHVRSGEQRDRMVSAANRMGCLHQVSLTHAKRAAGPLPCPDDIPA